MKGLTGFLVDVLKSNLDIGKNPYKLNFSVTDRCNSRCSKCSIWSSENHDEMTLEQIKEFFGKNRYLSWISLTGGEPFLRDDIVEIARSAYEMMDNLFLLNIPTNGLNTEDTVRKVEKIASIGIPKVYVTVSIDGPEKIHEELRGVEGGWKKAVKTFDKIRELSERYDNLGTVMTFTVHEDNQDVFEETVEEVDEEIGGVDSSDFNLTFHHSSDHYYRNEGRETVSLERLDDLLKNFDVGFTPEEVVNLMFLFNSREELYGNSIPCVAGKDSLFMMPDGDVYPCTVLDRKLGNVVEEGFELQKFVERFEPERSKCDGCWMPCEANQRMLGSLPGSFIGLVKNYLVNRRK